MIQGRRMEGKEWLLEIDGLVNEGWIMHFLPFRVTTGRGPLPPVIHISNPSK